MTVFHDPDEALARVQREIAAAHERTAVAQQVRAGIDAVRGVGRSPHGEVSVEVDAAGTLRDLTLSAEAMDLPPEDLSRLIIDAARLAHHDAGRRAVALAQDAFGADSAMVGHLRSELGQRRA